MTGETVILTPQSWHRGPPKEYGPTWVVAPCGTGCGNYAVVPAEEVERESVTAFRNPCGRCYPKHPYWQERKRYDAVVAQLLAGSGQVVIVEAEGPAHAFDRVADLLPHGAKITSVLPAVGDITWAVIVEGVRSQRVWDALVETVGV